jgi:hypothetical protein
MGEETGRKIKMGLATYKNMAFVLRVIVAFGLVL